MPTAGTLLQEGDYVQAVGSEESLQQFAVLVGERREGVAAGPYTRDRVIVTD